MVLAFVLLLPVSSAGSMRFGSDPGAVRPLAERGAAPDYAVVWAGPWNLRHGWGGVESPLRDMRAQGVVPVVQFYYWGDDISVACVENGCWSPLHDAQKTREGWQRLAAELAAVLAREAPGGSVVVLETEFNKGDAARWEGLDAYLAEKARFFKERVPNVRVVLGFGNWGGDAWPTFDRAVAAADATGIQGLRGSTRDSLSSYQDLANATLDGARRLQALFGKPVFVTDIALSSHPEPEYVEQQARALRALFARLPDLAAAGVEAILYRSWQDTPGMDPANYYGEAERHWGLAWSDGRPKPAGEAWLEGVAAARGGGGGGGGQPAPQPGPSAEPRPEPEPAPTLPPEPAAGVSFDVSPNVNDWWVEVTVRTAQPVQAVEARIDERWIALQPTAWGTWAASVNVPPGTPVAFRALLTPVSEEMLWLTFPAEFHLSPNVNGWWVEVGVESAEGVTSVEVSVDGQWSALPATSWSTWAKSARVEQGSVVQFRAWNEHGRVALGEPFTWPV